MMWLVLFLVFCTLYLYKVMYGRRKLLPPGPTPIPILGNIPHLDKIQPQRTLYEWGLKYGSVFTVWMGQKPVIFVNDYTDIKEVFTGHMGNILAGRPYSYVMETYREGRTGIIATDGKKWEEQKWFSHGILSRLGVGGGEMERRVKQQTYRLITQLKHDIGPGMEKTFDPTLHLQNCISNIAAVVIFGYGFQFEMDDQRFHTQMRIVQEVNTLLANKSIQFVQLYPWLRFVPLFSRLGLDDLLRNREEFKALIGEEMVRIKETFDPSVEPTTFCAAYFKEMDQREKSGQGMGYFTEDQWSRVAGELWVAGIINLDVTFSWILLYMLHHPQVQEKVQKELDEYFGSDNKEITMADKQNLPFTTATIMECQRFSNILAINVSHATMEDVTIKGYLLPKGTTVIPQISAVHLDPKIYPNPDKFRPTRFLKEDGSLKTAEYLVPFSVGKRSCLGEMLARIELFVVFANLMRHFTLLPDPTQTTLPPMERTKPGFCSIAPQFKVHFKVRK